LIVVLKYLKAVGILMIIMIPIQMYLEKL